MTAIAPHVTEFLRVRLPLERNASHHTAAAYSYTLQLLFSFLARKRKVRPSQLALEQVDADVVLAFLSDLETTRRNAITTRNARLAAIKSFFRYIELRVPSALDQVRRVLAIPTKKTTTGLVGYLNREEAQAIVDAPDRTTVLGVRDHAILHLALATGIRVSELVAIRVGDVTATQQPTLLVHGKGRRQRVLPLWRETVTTLRRWLAVRAPRSDNERALFLNARGEPITRSGVAYVLAKHAAAALTGRRGRVTPHVLRHTCAMATLIATKDVRQVALWLGHSRLETTEMYLRADPTEKLEAMTSLSALRLRRGRFPAADELMAALDAARSPPPQ